MKEPSYEPPAFNIGDRVRYNGPFSPGWNKGTHIISDMMYNGGFRYATNRGAWMDEEDLLLVDRATPSTIKELYHDSSNI